HAS
ncbi:hypothetical protein BN1723_019921, partial [Verticillium longisporum]